MFLNPDWAPLNDLAGVSERAINAIVKGEDERDDG